MLLKHATHELDFIIIQPNQVYQLYLVACLKSFSPEIQIFHYTLKCITLKADRPHLHDYLQTPTDCIHTDNHLRRVIVVVRALTYRETDGQTDGWTLSSTLFPCSLSYAVDNEFKDLPLNGSKPSYTDI